MNEEVLGEKFFILVLLYSWYFGTPPETVLRTREVAADQLY